MDVAVAVHIVDPLQESFDCCGTLGFSYRITLPGLKELAERPALGEFDRQDIIILELFEVLKADYK